MSERDDLVKAANEALESLRAVLPKSAWEKLEALAEAHFALGRAREGLWKRWRTTSGFVTRLKPQRPELRHRPPDHAPTP